MYLDILFKTLSADLIAYMCVLNFSDFKEDNRLARYILTVILKIVNTFNRIFKKKEVECYFKFDKLCKQFTVVWSSGRKFATIYHKGPICTWCHRLYRAQNFIMI